MGYWPPAAPPPLRTSYASRPVAGSSGQLWLPTDTIFTALDDGSQWNSFVQGVPVVDSGFPTSWRNQPTSATQDTSKGGQIIRCVPTTSLTQALLDIAQPSAPFTLTVGLIPAFTAGNSVSSYFWQAIYVMDSVSGKFIDLAIHNHGSTHSIVDLDVNEWNSATSFNVSLASFQVIPTSLFWLRIQDDNTNRRYSFSYDGVNFSEIFSHVNSTWVSANLRVGIETTGFYNGAAPKDTISWFVSWLTTQP
jgi:hypothetical protein